MLSLSLYLIVHYFLLLLTLIREDYDLDINDNEEPGTTTRESERTEYRITKQELTKLNLGEQNCSPTTFVELQKVKEKP